MKKIDGVAAATVSLKEGTVTLRFAPSNRATVGRIRETIRANGFSPKDADVRVAGRVTVRGDTMLLVLPEMGEMFLIEAAPGATQALGELRARFVGARVVITGTVPGSAKRDASRPQRLLVRSFVSAQVPPDPSGG